MAAHYVKVRWHHEIPDEPVLLLSEVEEGWEIRKVEIFRSGRRGRAGPADATGGSKLSEFRLPTPEEIAADPQFTVEPLSAGEFEREWRIAGGH